MFGHFTSTMTGMDWLKVIAVIGGIFLLIKGMNTPVAGGGNNGGNKSSNNNTTNNSVNNNNNNNTTNTN